MKATDTKFFNLLTENTLKPFVNYQLFEKSNLIWCVTEQDLNWYLYPLILIKLLKIRAILPMEIKIKEDNLIKYKIKKHYHILNYVFYIYESKDEKITNEKIVLELYPFPFNGKVIIKNNNQILKIKRNYFNIINEKFKYTISKDDYNNKEILAEIIINGETFGGYYKTDIKIIDNNKENIDYYLLSSVCLTLFHDTR